MPSRSATFATFAIERIYPVAPARVFDAWTSVETKQGWFFCEPSWVTVEQSLDFRVGGREINRVGPEGGPLHVFDAVFHDIVPDERIVFAYDMWLGETRISVSLSILEFKATAGGTHFTFTEQGVYLDGYDGAAEREEGTAVGLDQLGRWLTGD